MGMNRDEQRTRVKGIFSEPRLQGRVRVAGPSEPSGGMWAGTNSFGVTYALLNWYARPFAEIQEPISRGVLVESVAWLGIPSEVQALIERQDLKRYRPFRLLGVFGAEKTLWEWRSDGTLFEVLKHSWERRHWASSGYDEAGAQQARKEVFITLSHSSELTGKEWLRSFHRNHLPEKGAMSVCMHRSEAATVSFTEFEIDRQLATVTYFNGPPCEVEQGGSVQIPVISRRSG